MCVCVYIYIYISFKKSVNFLTRTIILLIFIRRVHVRENRGKERNNKKYKNKKRKEKDELCERKREIERCNNVKSYQVGSLTFLNIYKKIIE